MLPARHARQHELGGHDKVRLSVQNSGTQLNRHPTINFSTGLTATEDAANERITITGDHGGLGGLTDDDHTQYVKHALATAASDFLVASGAGAFVKKTLAEVKALVVPMVVYSLYNQQNGEAVHANPGTAYTYYIPTWTWGTGVNATFTVHVVFDTYTYTYARLLCSCSGNEAGNAKGVKVTINGTAVGVEWNGNAAADRDSGWVAINSPGGIAAVSLLVKGSSGTEDINVSRTTLLLK
jgi:hypothetical protein